MKIKVYIYTKKGENEKVKVRVGEIKKLMSCKRYKKEFDMILKKYKSPYFKIRELHDKVFSKDYILEIGSKFVLLHGTYLWEYNNNWEVKLYENKINWRKNE